MGYNTDIDYSIEPLDFTTFHPKTPNALLKSIEEPPNNTTFVFLTNSKENIIQTIVSRCFAFKLSSNISKKGYSDIINILDDYPSLKYSKALYIADSFNEISLNGKSAEEILTEFIEYLKDLMLQNIDNQAFYNKVRKDILTISRYIKYSKAKIQNKYLFEGLMLELTKG